MPLRRADFTTCGFTAHGLGWGRGGVGLWIFVGSMSCSLGIVLLAGCALRTLSCGFGTEAIWIALLAGCALNTLSCGFGTVAVA